MQRQPVADYAPVRPESDSLNHCVCRSRDRKVKVAFPVDNEAMCATSPNVKTPARGILPKSSLMVPSACRLATAGRGVGASVQGRTWDDPGVSPKIGAATGDGLQGGDGLVLQDGDGLGLRTATGSVQDGDGLVLGTATGSGCRTATGSGCSDGDGLVLQDGDGLVLQEGFGDGLQEGFGDGLGLCDGIGEWLGFLPRIETVIGMA